MHDVPHEEPAVAEIAGADPGQPTSAPSGESTDHGHSTTHLRPADIGADLGSRATLVQFSSAFCQPCRATRLVLADVATKVPGVEHVEVDAETHLELVRRLHVMRTPTVFVLDASGEIRKRASGLARKPDVLAALADFVPEVRT